MALDLSKLNFFNRLDARARVFVLFGSVIGIIFLIYLGSLYFSSGPSTIGPSQVANAPKSLQSVPGGTLTAEYSKALQQANVEAAQQAQMKGTSAVPTLMNYGQSTAPAPSANCNIICTDQSSNVKYNLDDWVKQGKVATEVSSELQDLANKNVPVSEYAAELDRLVKEGKLTPEQARELLEQYKKQHENALLADSAKTMDDLIKSGKLPLDVANQLLTAQKNKVSPAEYAAMLQRLVREGKISPEVAAQLLAQYTQQHAKEVTQQSIAFLHQMARSGQILPEVEKELVDLENKMVPLDTYSTTVQRLVTAGKMIPAVAGKILDDYKAEKASIGPSGSINQMLQKAEAAAFGEISDLVKAGKMSPEIGDQLSDLIRKNVPLDAFTNFVNQLVQQGKLSPEIGKLKIADYQSVKGLRDMSDKLNDLQANNASNAAYMDELKRQVQAGVITPDQAEQLLQEYQAATSSAPLVPAQTGPTTAAFAALQQRVAQGAAANQPVAASEQFTAAQVQAAQVTAQDEQARIDALTAAMSGQAGQLVSAWQPVPMLHKQGSQARSAEGAAAGKGAGAASTTEMTTLGGAPGGVPLIKSGTIIFAVLDTTANSDYPDSPVLATVVDGPYKGAKLLGKLVATKSVSGQLDRIALNFTLMNVDTWPKSKAITAYGIDPDTARTVLASQVDYHYLQRYGAIMATSFLQGYANAITQAGTSTTGIFGTSTTHPALSPGQKIMTALGQMGQTLGTATANYINIPPTVKVDAGV
jgi:polyhydroxyalkanoate synthesis regulator phasin